MLIQEKVAQAKAILKEFNVDCWITFVRESEINGDPTLDFLLGVPVTWHSAFIITSAGQSFAIVGKYDHQTVADTGAYDDVQSFVEGIHDLFIARMKALNPSAIAINYSQGSEICDGLTHGMYLTLCEMLAEIGFEDRLISAEPVVSALRQRKTATEIERIRAAITATENIFEDVASFIKPGKSETEIADTMKGRARSAGFALAWGEAACPAVFTGPDTAGAHYAPTDRQVAPGHVLNMDFGLRYQGYCSDLQRTFYICRQNETSAPDAVLHGFDTIITAIELARNGLKSGVLGHEIDAIARQHLIANGYDEFPHGLGHQVGRFAHDGTALLGPPWEKYAQKPFQPVEAGMVFTLEPRLTVPDFGVVTVEEMVLVTDHGAEYLSTPQQRLWLI